MSSSSNNLEPSKYESNKDGADPKKGEISKLNYYDSGEKSHNVGETKERDHGNDDEEEDCEPCILAKVLKSGGCRKEFTPWLKCMYSAKTAKELDQCIELERDLEKCMDAHSSYYDPLLRAMYNVGSEMFKDEPKGGQEIQDSN
ncbi:Tripartite terminase subunit 3 [Bienertia sinuspersici]